MAQAGNENEEGSETTERWPGRSTPGWDAVDEAGWQSFPASDPPAFGSAQRRCAPESKRPIAGGTREPGRAALTAAERRALLEALDDEYKAWATYDRVIADFGPERPFINIRDAEARHIGALLTLFRRYGLDIPVNPWPERVTRFASLREACEAAIAAEVENVALFDRLVQSTERPDLRAVLRNLQRASQESHLPAFRRCAERGAGAGHGHEHGPGRGQRGCCGCGSAGRAGHRRGRPG